MASSQLIFMKGKEKALDALFDGNNDKAAFGYLAVGFNEDATTNGFVDPYINVGQENGFMEIEGSNRIPLSKYEGESIFDEDTGKVTVKYKAELDASNVPNNNINQIAVVSGANPEAEDDEIYSATTFQTFYKTSSTSLTFVIGFQI